ncbi:Chemotaxis protein CheA [Pluralibacter gergoviae]|nr:Chemotaxis protein CheA [Pluralibacter gergoviae]
MENLLDEARRGEMTLSVDIINLFLETKDIMQEQLEAYKHTREPDAASFEYICSALRQLALEAKGEPVEPPPSPAVLKVVAPQPAAGQKMRIHLHGLKAGEAELLQEELGNLARVTEVEKTADSLSAVLEGDVAQDDIAAVLCFVIDADQISFCAAGGRRARREGRGCTDKRGAASGRRGARQDAARQRIHQHSGGR